MIRRATLLLLLAAAPALAARRAGVATPLPPGAVRIDGDLTDWSPGRDGLAPPIELTEGTSTVEEGMIASDADQRVDVHAAIGDGALWVAALVTDDAVQAQHRKGEMWRGDMVEVLLRDARGGYLHVGVNPAGDFFVFHPLQKQPEKNPLGIRAAARVGRPGYTVELRIPLAAFGAGPDDRHFDVNFAARDLDPNESPPGHRTWSGVRHNLLASFGTLTLDPTPRPAPPPLACAPLPGPGGAKPVQVAAPLRAAGRKLVAPPAGTPVRLRMLNFQSAAPSWEEFWTDWDLVRVRKDLDRAAALGTNALRIFIFTGPFGGATPNAEMVSRATALIDEAARRGMVTVVSFFPFDKDFRVERRPEMEAHLRAFVARFRGDPAIAMWDLMNEPDHQWMKPETGVKPKDVSDWATLMARAVREADPTHLVTVGLAGHYAVNAGPARAEESLPLVDVQSIHWYFGVDRLAAGLAKAKATMEKPLILQEFGVSGLMLDDAAASAVYEKACDAARRADLSGFGAWELYDHPVGSVRFVDTPWRENVEHYFGLLRADGTPKQQASAFCNCLDVTPLAVVREERATRPAEVPR